MTLGTDARGAVNDPALVLKTDCDKTIERKG
jgi:hypothetical protein